MLEGYLDSWGSSSEESVEQHRADSRCIGVLALLAGGGTVEMMPISHFINLLRGTFSMNLLLSNRDSGQVLKMCLNIYKSLRVHWSWILSWSQLYFTNFPKGKLFHRVWNASLEDYIPTVLGKTRLYSHTLSVRRNNRVQRPDMKYLEFDLGVGQGINLYFVIPVTKWFTSPRFTYMEVWLIGPKSGQVGTILISLVWFLQSWSKKEQIENSLQTVG